MECSVLVVVVETATHPHVLLTFHKVQNPSRMLGKKTSDRPKVVRAPLFLTLLTCKCVLGHNGVHLFGIWTAKSGPNPAVFCTFDLDMCFAPQQHAIFHLLSGRLAPLQRAYFSTLLSHKSLEKHSESRLSYLFADLHLLFSLSFSSLIFSLPFLLLLNSSHLCFSICPYCRKFDF